MNDDEALSRLIDGDLDPATAAALRARLSAEPTLAARHAALLATVAALRALPAELPPPGRPAALGPAPRAPPALASSPVSWAPGRRWAGVAVAAAAALAAALLLAPRPAPRAVLLDGQSVVDGRAEVLAAGMVVTVDGRALVSVEPPPGGLREDPAELTTMDRSHLATALAGALVTVTVYEGRAWVEPAPGSARLELGAGDSRALGVGGAGGGSTPRAEPGAARAPELADARIRQLEAELAAAKAAADRPEAGPTPKPTPWPSPAPAGFAPGDWRRRLDAAAAEIPGARVVEVDCDEFPCVAVLTRDGGGPGWLDAFGTLHEAMNDDGVYGGDLAVTGMASVVADDAGETQLYAFALEPAETGPNPRTQARARAALDELAGHPSGPGPAAEEQLLQLGYVDVE